MAQVMVGPGLAVAARVEEVELLDDMVAAWGARVEEEGVHVEMVVGAHVEVVVEVHVEVMGEVHVAAVEGKNMDEMVGVVGGRKGSY